LNKKRRIEIPYRHSLTTGVGIGIRDIISDYRSHYFHRKPRSQKPLIIDVQYQAKNCVSLLQHLLKRYVNEKNVEKANQNLVEIVTVTDLFYLKLDNSLTNASSIERNIIVKIADFWAQFLEEFEEHLLFQYKVKEGKLEKNTAKIDSSETKIPPTDVLTALLKKSIPRLDNDKNYYYIRTKAGKLYEDFLEKSIVGLEYDFVKEASFQPASSTSTNFIRLYKGKKVLRAELRTKKVKNDIIRTNDYDENDHKAVISTIYNKIDIFAKMKLGDIVVIPSEGTNRISIGEIIDDKLLIDKTKSDYSIVKKVKWIRKDLLFRELDANFLKLKFTQHAISDVSYLSNHVNQNVNPLYVDNKGVLNFVIDIRHKEGIKTKYLTELLSSVNTLTEVINEEFGFNEDLSDLEVELNVQSPGKIKNAIKTISIPLGLAAGVISHQVSNLNKGHELYPTITEIMKNEKVKETAQAFDTIHRKLYINRSELAKIYK